MPSFNINTGPYIAIIGIVVEVLTHFGIILDSNQVGQTVTDIAKVVGDLAVIWGIFHSWYAGRKAAKMAIANGTSKQTIRGIK